jgi:hypothetical protein
MYQRAGYVVSDTPPMGHPHINGVVYLRKPR